MSISFIIPVYNPKDDFKKIITIIKNYRSASTDDVEIIIVDSSDDDSSTEFLLDYKDIKLIKINKQDFNHGGTRNKAFLQSKGDFVIFLTQDAIPIGISCFKSLIHQLETNSSIGIVYGRQKPKKNADFFGAFSRKFNYPDKSIVKSMKDIKKLGIKTTFNSNSFAAYRRRALEDINGFPTHTILGEDTFAAAKMLINGWLVLYDAEACVYHSHNYTVIQEFKRYFDIGVFYGKERWITQTFSKAEGEGKHFLLSQLKELIEYKKFNLIPNFLVRNILKYLGYKLGTVENLIPKSIKKMISMNKLYWEDQYSQKSNY